MSTKQNSFNQPLHFSSAMLAAGYVATVLGANYAIMNIGYPTESGVHVIPVFPGVDAPSGVIFAGLAFSLRDLVQERIDKTTVVICIAAGAGLSAIISAELAAASAIAFLVSELLDFAVYTSIRQRSKTAAVFASNSVGLVIDSVLFLWISNIPMMFLSGQILGKLWMTILAILVMIFWNRKSRQSSEMD